MLAYLLAFLMLTTPYPHGPYQFYGIVSTTSPAPAGTVGEVTWQVENLTTGARVAYGHVQNGIPPFGYALSFKLPQGADPANYKLVIGHNLYDLNSEGLANHLLAQAPRCVISPVTLRSHCLEQIPWP